MDGMDGCLSRTGSELVPKQLGHAQARVAARDRRLSGTKLRDAAYSALWLLGLEVM